MSFRQVIRRAAREEFDEAFDGYESQREGLGVEFAGRVESALERIAANPELHACVFGEVRRAAIRPFPYSIFYRIRGDQVDVLAVFHNKRDPKVWQSRG